MTDERLSKYPKTDKFRVVDTIGVPHPYVIGIAHVSWAADHYGGMLTKEAIIDAEKRHHARCNWNGCNLSYEEHKTALLVEVDDKRDLQEVWKDGLQAYLLSIKDMAVADGFEGFAFKQRKI